MNLLIQVGLIELAIAALLGWAVVIRSEKPEWIQRLGVVQPHRILQIHLDYIMMGLIAIGVGVVLPDIPQLAAYLLASAPSSIRCSSSPWPSPRRPTGRSGIE